MQCLSYRCFAKRDGSPYYQACRPGTGVKTAASSCELCLQVDTNLTKIRRAALIARLENLTTAKDPICFPCEKGTTTYETGSTVCVLKRIDTICLILDNLTYRNESDPTELCFSWILPRVITKPGEKRPIFDSQLITWSRNRLFPSVSSGRTNSTSVSNSTTSLCIRGALGYPAALSKDLGEVEKLALGRMPLDDVVTYIGITPIVGDACGTPSPPTKAWAVATRVTMSLILTRNYQNMSCSGNVFLAL